MAGKDTLPIPENPLKVLKALTKEKIPFVIIGGAAIALHGIPRSTLDIDILVPSEGQTPVKLFSTMEGQGLSCSDKHIVKIIDRPRLLIGQWLTFTDKDGREFIDVFFEDEGEFNKIFKRAKKIKERQFSFYIASLDDLQKMKKESGRPIDLADIALIREKRKTKT
jgi:hypothetical protein